MYAYAYTYMLTKNAIYEIFKYLTHKLDSTQVMAETNKHSLSLTHKHIHTDP
jgi:hypothetical protein